MKNEHKYNTNTFICISHIDILYCVHRGAHNGHSETYTVNTQAYRKYQGTLNNQNTNTHIYNLLRNINIKATHIYT